MISPAPRSPSNSIGSAGGQFPSRLSWLGEWGVLRRPAPLAAWLVGLILLGGLVYLAPLTSAWLFIGIALAVPVTRLVWSYPALGVVALSFFATALLPQVPIPLPLAGVHLDAPDLVLVGMLTLVIVQGVHRGTLKIPCWSMTGPLLAFAGLAIASALYARFAQGVNLGLAGIELRPAVYCAGAAIIVAVAVRRQQIPVLLTGLFIVADLIAGAIMYYQFASPPTTSITDPPSGLWQINYQGGAGGGFGSVRVVPPAHVLVFVMANIAFCLMLGRSRTRWLRGALTFQFAFLGLALLLTYTRAQWIASGIALLLACLLLPPLAKRNLGRLVLLLFPFATLAAVLIGTNLLPLGGANAGQALADRFTSIFTPQETLGTASLEWRDFELQAAYRSITENPILGVGLGNDYREVTLLQGEASGWLWTFDGDSRLTRFIHNSYLYLAVKAGLVTFAVFCWFYLAFLINGVRTYFSTPDGPNKLTVLAIVCSFVGFLVWAIFQAHFMVPSSMTTLGIMVGIVAVVGSCRGADNDAAGSRADARSETIVP